MVASESYLGIVTYNHTTQLGRLERDTFDVRNTLRAISLRLYSAFYFMSQSTNSLLGAFVCSGPPVINNDQHRKWIYVGVKYTKIIKLFVRTSNSG